MKNLLLILTAAFFAASGSMQAAGTIKTYVVEAAFAPDDSVDLAGPGASAGDATSLQLPCSVKGAAPNPSSNAGPLTIVCTSGPVMGVGVRIQANEAGPFTSHMNAYDAAGNLLGTTTIRGTAASATPENPLPFIGIRSSLKEIAKVEIDSSSAHGFTISGLRLGLHPIIENDWFFVNQLFQDLYGRTPIAAEMSASLNALKDGTSTRAQVAASLFQSSEFHDGASFLVKCYLALIQPDPDFNQWSQILKLIQGGVNQNNVLNALMNTREYAARYPQGLGDGDFVAKVHQNLLGRDPAAGEMDLLVSNLAQGNSRRDMVEGFLKSPEFELRIAGRVDVCLAYLALLRRGGESAAIARWTDKLNSGATVADLMGDLISQPEYIARF